MPYGRLDVSSPDGPIQIFALSEPVVSIGRSTGNTIVLDNNTISRYHFNISVDEGRVYITDLESANGTFVDGVKLAGKERHLLFDGDEIIIGNLRMIFHDIDDTPTVKLKPLDETTQRIEMALANFYIDIQGPEQSIPPGAYISAELVITNTTDTDERFRIEVSGPPEEWIRIDRPTPLIAAGETGLVIINFKPARHSGSAPGEYKVAVRVYPKNKPSDVLEASLVLMVLPFAAFAMGLEKNTLGAGERFHLLLHNQGSATLPITLAGISRGTPMTFRFAASQLTLAPGQQRVVEGEARPSKRQLLGRPHVETFDLTAHSQDHAGYLVPLRVSLMVNPVLPGWALAASAVTLSVVGLIIVVILFALLRTPPANPRFTDFSIDKTELARGDVLELKWQAEDVTGLRLLVDGTPVATLEPQLANYSLNTDSFSGPISLQLEAWNGDQRDTRSVQVLVYEPMHVERFDATPQEMVRYVVQGLNLVWDVPGATRTRVTGLEDFTSTVIAADGPSGNFPDIPGIPLEPLILTLMGEDNYGNVLEHSLTVNLVNPECSPSSGPVQLYVGPGVVYQVVGTIPADATVVVDARDTSGGWLRVTGLSGLGSAWASSVAFNCATNFNVNDLRIETNVPTPAPTPTATLTPLPTFTPTLTPTLLPLPTLTPSG